MQVAASLRPNIKEGEDLTAQEFEEHLRILAKELDRPGIVVEKIGFLNFFDKVKEDFSFSPLRAIYQLITLTVLPVAYGDRIKIQGKTAFILPLIAAILSQLLITSPGNIIFCILYVSSSIVEFFYGYVHNTSYMRHELKHVYVFLMLLKLKKEGLLSLSINRAQALLPSDDGFSPYSTDEINTRELEEIENTIINSLFPEPNLNSYTNELPESDIPVDSESNERVLKIRVLYQQI